MDLADMLLRLLATFEHELRLDVDAELIAREDARRIDREERAELARVLAELRRLERSPYPSRSRSL